MKAFVLDIDNTFLNVVDPGVDKSTTLTGFSKIVV